MPRSAVVEPNLCGLLLCPLLFPRNLPEEPDPVRLTQLENSEPEKNEQYITDLAGNFSNRLPHFLLSLLVGNGLETRTCEEKWLLQLGFHVNREKDLPHEGAVQSVDLIRETFPGPVRDLNKWTYVTKRKEREHKYMEVIVRHDSRRCCRSFLYKDLCFDDGELS
ncbi:hypothetical protein ACFE04_002398 [Oxalis oulophora]